MTSRQPPLLAILLIGLSLLILPFAAGAAGDAWVRILVFALLYVMLALGLNIVVGYAGLLDLGYVAFYAVGAYLYALLTAPHLVEVFSLSGPLLSFDGPMGTLKLLMLLSVAGLLAGVAGVLLGTPVLGLRGDYLAIVTLGFGEIIRIFMLNLNAPVNLTNGPQGITGIAPLQVLGQSFGEPLVVAGLEVSGIQLTYFLLLAGCLAIAWLCLRLERAPLGRAWAAIREDELAAKAMGIPTKTVKLQAFAIGASFGGVSGALFAGIQGFVSPESFTLMESIVIVAMVVLGGMGSVAGVILGAVLLYAIPEVLRLVANPIQVAIFGDELVAPEALRLLLFGLALTLIVRLRPGGLIPARTGGPR